jgi:DNA-binding CsgD family transcriptional regulator
MRRSTALGTLHELAQIPALGAEGLAALRAALSDLVPLDSVCLTPTDSLGFATGFQGDEVFNSAVAQRFYEHHYGTPSEDGLGPNCRLLFRRGERVFSASRGATQWRESDVFQDVFAPAGVNHLVRMLFRQGGRAVGLLLLARVGGEDFSAGDIATLLEQHAVIGQAVDRICRPVQDGVTAPLGEATWIFTLAGEIEASSLGAADVASMAYAAGGPWTGAEPCDAPLAKTFADLRRMLEEGRRADLCERSRFGRFRFHASWLESQRPPFGRRVKVDVVHEVPLHTRLFLSRRFRALPQREKQTALLLAEGHSTKDIADRAGVAESTALSWVRSLFQRFSVRRRGELVEALLGHDGLPALSPQS